MTLNPDEDLKKHIEEIKQKTLSQIEQLNQIIDHKISLTTLANAVYTEDEVKNWVGDNKPEVGDYKFEWAIPLSLSERALIDLYKDRTQTLLKIKSLEQNQEHIDQINEFYNSTELNEIKSRVLEVDPSLNKFLTN